MNAIEMVAVQAIIDQEGLRWEDIAKANAGFPRLTSGVTATIDVTVTTKNKISFTVPVTVRLEFVHPVALL